MKTKYGATSITLLRTISVTIALLLSVLASIILARKLSPESYALYQTITKRLTRYSEIPFYLTDFWIYRYMVQRIRGSWEASLIVLTLSVILGLAVGFAVPLHLGFPLVIAVLGGLTLASFEMIKEVNLIVDALRPVRFGILQVIYRLTYSSLIFIFVYVLLKEALGALVSVVVSSLFTALVGLFWVKSFLPRGGDPLNVLKEWMKGISIPLLNTAIMFTTSLDVFIAYKLLGENAVAGFFVSLAIFSLLREPMLRGVRFLQGYLLGGGEVRDTVKSLGVLIVVISPILSYIIFNPVHIIYLLNPKYYFASKAIIVLSFDTIVFILLSIIRNLYVGVIGGNAVEASRKLLKIYTLLLGSSFLYLLILFTTFSITKSVLVGPFLWSAALLIFDLVSLAVTLITFPKKELKALILRHIGLSLVYFVLSLPIAYIIRVSRPPSPRFFDELRIMILPLVAVMILYYAVIIAVSKELRRGLLKFISSLLERVSALNFRA